MEEEEGGSKYMISHLDSVPPGYRFKPSDLELILHYLKPKVYNKPFQPNIINEVQLYHYNPDTLTEEYPPKNKGEREWYFFTPRDRKYRNGKRPGRAAGEGFWKATGADKQIKSGKTTVGLKKTLVFYRGRPPKGNKTQWIMHEFVLKDPPARQRASHDDMRLDDWVLCRIYNKHNKHKEHIFETSISKEDEEYSIPKAMLDAFPHIEIQECGNFGGRDYHDMPKMKISEQQESTPIPVTCNEFQQNGNGNYARPQTNQFNMMALHNNINIGGFDDLAMFPQQEDVFDYGTYVPTPITSIPPQFFVSDHEDLGLMTHQQQPPTTTPIASIPPQSCVPSEQDCWSLTHQQPQQQPQFSGSPNSISQFTMDDGYLLNTDFGVANDWEENPGN